MTPNEARIEAVKKVVAELRLDPNSGVLTTTDYGFTMRIGEHRVRLSAQAEEAKHSKRKRNFPLIAATGS